MKTLVLVCFALALLGTHLVARAQVHPCEGPGPGEVVVGQTDASNGVASVPLCRSVGEEGALGTQTQSLHWQTRWGAIATDTPHGILGAVTDMQSRREAEQKALADCKAKGGSPCKLDISYKNGCAALTISDTGYNTAADADTQKATQAGMDTCTKAGAKNCQTYYTACSPAAVVQ